MLRASSAFRTTESRWVGRVPTLITLRLFPLYDGCHRELFHYGFERLSAGAGEELQGYEQGWFPSHLDALKEIVEG
jgi:hypothetical protein